jgi:hypothetical protein
MALQRVKRSLQQPLRHECIKTADYDRKAGVVGNQGSLYDIGH